MAKKSSPPTPQVPGNPPAPNAPLRVQTVSIKNFKGAREIRIHANELVNELVGDNGAGKSSVLDAILAAIAGARNIDPEPLRHGATRGEIVLDLGTIKITRRFTQGNQDTGGTLTIKAGDDAKMGQKDLNDLFNDLTFDPLAFSRMKPEEQVKALEGLSGPDFLAQLRTIEAKAKAAFDARAGLNAQIKALGTPQPPIGNRPQAVDVKDLVAKLREADLANAARAEQQKAHDDHNKELASYRTRIQDLQAELSKLREQLKILEAEVPPAPEGEKIDTAPLTAAFSTADITNRASAAWASFDQLQAKLVEIRKAAEEHDLALRNARTDREELIQSAQLPIPGLSWGGSGVALNKIPFAQLSSAERIRVSAHLGMAVSGRLRIMLIRDGSLLDAKSFAQLLEVAREHQTQLWVETVGAGHSDDYILIENGATPDSAPDLTPNPDPAPTGPVGDNEEVF